MRILERYVLREHLFPFLIGFSIVVFLLTLDFLFDLVDLAIGKGISAGIVRREQPEVVDSNPNGTCLEVLRNKKKTTY